MGGTQIRLPVGGGLSSSGLARGGRSCWATWRKASKRKSHTPSPRVAAWTRVAARMPVLVWEHIGFYDVRKSQNLQHQKKHPFK